MMNTKQSIKHIALVLVLFFTAVTAFGESLWKFQGWKTGWCSYGDRNSITYHDLSGGFPKDCYITEKFYDGGVQFDISGKSKKKSKMTIMSLWSHIENVPSYTRRVLTWEYKMRSYAYLSHVQTVALYASEDDAIKYASVDCTENYTDGSGSDYLLSRLNPNGDGTVEESFTKTFTIDNRNSSTTSNKEWSLLLAYSIFNGGNANVVLQSANINTTGTSWKDYYYKEITFLPNGGSSSSAMPKQTIETSGKLNACTIKRDGYCFIGWNTKADGSGTFYKDQATIEANSTDKGPVTLYAQWVSPATKLSADFNQTDNQVRLSWSPGSIPSNFKNYKWVIYRDDVKIGTCNPGTYSFVDQSMATEATHTYDIYFVSKNWNEGDKRDGTKASVKVNTTRRLPVNNLKVDPQDDRIVFTWTSDGYPSGWGNQFKVYIDKQCIYTITPLDMQTDFRWEHVTTNEHEELQNNFDEEKGILYSYEPLNACDSHNYRIEGLIGDIVFNKDSIENKAIGTATKFLGFDASKGIYEGSVKLSWQVDRQGSTLAKTYIVERRESDKDNNWIRLTSMSSDNDYPDYTDQTALPGIYYDYRVTVKDKCANGTELSNEISDIGFAKSTGIVTGRIAYGSSGIAVKGVDVVMTKTCSEGESSLQYHAMYFSDPSGSVIWKYPSTDYATETFSEKDFSIQMWLCPDKLSTSTILKMGNKAFLYMTEDGKLNFLNNANVKTFRDTLTANTYNHVTLTRKGAQMICYIMTFKDSNDPIIQKDTITLDGNLRLNDADTLKLGHFKGSVDEFRLWTKCLSEKDILENYNHLLVGNEEGLETYWTFDEGLTTRFFDYSRTGTDYHSHHGSIVSNAKPVDNIPSVLELRAKTDADGNYVIQGVPFSGAGTTYTVTPLLGIHDFNPNKSVLFVGQNALVHNKTNFEDVSSFPMEGYIYYAGTNIPVEGVMFYVDGELLSGNGEIKQTDERGYYSISVPIGKHYVEAKKGGHTMVAGGRFPTQGTFNFDCAVIHDFADSTLVNFVGRVGGGERNDTLGVGFGASKNNIGIATVTLELNNESLSFNCADDHISAAATDRTWNNDTTTTNSINSTAWTGIGAESKYIHIRTDKLTGEFSAMLPPLKYFTKSIRIDTNPDIEFSSLTEIDLTNPQKELKDSLELETGEKKFYTYNTKMVRAYYAEPVVEMSQPGNAKGMFGMKEYQGSDQLGDFTVSPLWTQKNGYVYGFPIYNMGDPYRLSFFAYERYLNYDNGASQPVEDIIPLNGKVLTIANEMSNSQTVVCVPDQGSDYQSGEVYNLQEDQIQLDDKGCATIEWTAGPPNVVAPYTRHLDVIMEQNGRTMVPASLDAIVVGGLPLGNNFVTQGPDKVLMVLRDPPGAKSRTIWKRGTTTTKIKTRVNGGFGDEKAVLINGVGVATETYVTAIGIMCQATSILTGSNIGGGLHYRWTADNSTEEVWNVTATQEVSTSPGSNYCGSRGDVFIGVSTNLLLGECRKVGFFRDNATAPFVLKDDVAISVGDSVTTNFMYSTYELEEVMVPKWRDTRNSYLTQHVNTEAEAKAVVNNTNDMLYVTWLKEDDENYGKGGTYLPVIPEAWKNDTKMVVEDKVAWCNNQIESWRQVLANNEKDKVDAIDANQQYWKRNISFDGGSSYTYTERKDTTKTKTVSQTHNIGVIFNWGNKTDVVTGVYMDIHYGVDTENGYSRKEVDGNKDYEFAEFDYVFDDGNPGTDFSVDVYKSPGGWSDLFRLIGGQSYNPYEGEEKTKYYEPGQHVLSNGTVQMEQPFIGVSTDGNIAAKQATLSDIPAGGTGQFTLHLTNGTTTNQSFNFSYNLSVLEKANQQGLEVLMDGVPVTGRSISIPAGETIKKVITVRQTDQSVLNYEDINIRFASPYQPNKIFDQCTLNVHFKPSSSPIDLVVTEPVINTESQNGKLSIKLTNFNRQFKNLRKVGVQYRFEGNTQWIDLHTWVTNPADTIGTSKESVSLLEGNDIRYEVNMSFPE